MKPDINDAKEYFSTTIASNGAFSPYSTAYAVTNENLRYDLTFMPKETENALVVAASGDHPMFTALNGAKNIDTFDLSYNAKLIMDIKTAALKLLNCQEYCKLISDIHSSCDISSVDNAQKIIDILPVEEQHYINEMRGYKLFCHGLHPSGYIITKPLPTQEEYDKMREIITKSFNFIWSNITCLHTKLDKSYDFIHLSNILDYINIKESGQILISLMEHTQPGAVICLKMTFYPPLRVLSQHKEFYKMFLTGNKWKMLPPQSKYDSLYVMQRVK